MARKDHLRQRLRIGEHLQGPEVEPYRGLARYILAIFQKYAIFAQFWPTPLSLSLLKTCQTTIWFHFTQESSPPRRRSAAESASTEVLQNSIKFGCNTRLKGVGNLPHKTDLKLYFELGLKG